MSYGEAQYIIDTVKTNTSTTIGTANATGGTATAGTVTAKLNALITTANTISTNASNAASSASSANSNASSAKTNASTAATNAANAYTVLTNGTYGLSALNTKLTNGSVPIVKSVQRGTHAGLPNCKSDFSDKITITISSVSTDKTIVILMPAKTSVVSTSNSGPTYGTYTPSLLTMTSTSITVTASSQMVTSYTSLPFSWQVIEFY